MKNIRKVTAILLLTALLLSLTGCSIPGLGRKDANNTEKEKLQSILNDLSENLHPGTAGNSLTAIRIAADLISWASSTDMDKKEAAAVAGQWLKEQAPEIRDAFREKISTVSSYYGNIIKDGASGMLEAAGVEKDFSNLGEKLKEIVEAVLASGGLD